LMIGFMTGRFDTLGIDLVAMCVNDIITCGAEPLFFLDYFACGKLEPTVAAEVIGGVAEGCKQAGCALVGGETAEMPDMYKNGEFDLAGFAVGVVERDRIVDGSNITDQDCLIGVASSGLHSNGFSLVRKIFFDQLGWKPDDRPDGIRGTVADELLIPTKIYAKTVLNLLRDLPIHGIVHITGGGLLENIPRILPDACQARIIDRSWKYPPVFDVLQKHGEISDREMYKTFNCGLGLVIICPNSQARDVLTRLSGLGENAWVIGEIVSKKDAALPQIEIVAP